MMFKSNQSMESQMLFNMIRDRHSTRRFNPDINISEEELIEMLEQAALAPSGGNLQSWRFLVINTSEMKEKLYSIAYNQKQVVEASAVIAVLGDVEAYTKAEKIYSLAADEGYISSDIAKALSKRYIDLYSSLSLEEVRQIVCIDCGLVSMQLMLTAHSKGYDTVPMTGYDKEKFSITFNVPKQYFPVLLIALGKAKIPGQPSVRLPIEEVVFFNEF